ncbi:MAG TPA: 2-hydroxyacid dehydrogenase [Mycobacterium sp.]|nr:2-hydroxyacid dehydrogenase [Mycobacterium sp.]
MVMTILEVGALPKPLRQELAVKYQTLQLPNDASRPAFLAEHGASVTVVVVGPPGMDAAVIDALPNLGAIVHFQDSHASGDVDEAPQLGIAVSHSPNAFNYGVAETAVGLMLDMVRGFCADGFGRVRRGLGQLVPPLAHQVSGLRVGLLDLSRIGSAIASRLAVELAVSVDALMTAMAGGKGTDKLIDRAVLEALGPDGYLVINTASGGIVDPGADESDALRQWRAFDNGALFPHIADATRDDWPTADALVLGNLDEYFKTLTTPVVNPTHPPSGTSA